MSKNQNLPIYKATYDLMLNLMNYVKNMEKGYKQLIGNKLLEECSESILMIYKANYARGKERVNCINLLKNKLEVLQLLIRLSKDLRLISIKQFSNLIEIQDSINKQING
jgi:hypothetical protein